MQIERLLILLIIIVFAIAILYRDLSTQIWLKQV